jgi:hypothetical protein
MKHCIWCKRTELETDFKKLAHTIPKSLGGKMICINVCDECNSYFGNISDCMPAIEETIKETFNISRARFLKQEDYGQNKALVRFKSKYFNVNLKEHKMSVKPAFQIKPGFQMILALQLKRGIYKMFLEELERQEGTGHDSCYDFIREYARYNKGDLPLFYFERRYGVVLSSSDWIKSPELFITHSRMKYLIENDYFFEFEFLGHVFAIAKCLNWQNHYDKYIEESEKIKAKFFTNLIEVQFLTDIDLTLRIMNG